MNWKKIAGKSPALKKLKLSVSAQQQVTIEMKYEGYIKRQLNQIEKFKRLENKPLPGQIDYLKLTHLSREAKEKLDRVKPVSLGQASRIAGVTPADISVLMVHLRK
ncbi:MAG: tRNA uridine-5-carboxymethylaminomethyl(34) synthesis enzyme MnmG, partial [Planctomycetes bacterium]|nr:tRNA uridine-5-carboxymethylaminomethyl(34) synthesis enzyme MnmG [Planctomycetota bacterium]